MGFTRPAAWAAMLMLAAVPAAAQTRPERPSRALFGSGVGDVSQLLTASASLGGGFDSSVASDARGNRTGVSAADLASSREGLVTGARVALNYSLATNPFTLVAAAESAPRYYPSVRDEIIRRDHASLRGDLRLPFALVASGSVGYVPYSVLGFTRSEVGADDLESPDEFPVSPEHYITWRAGLGTSRRLSRRTYFDADASYRARRVGSGEREFYTAGGGGRLRYQAAEHLFLKAGYRYVEARYDGRTSYARHLIDVGADMSRDFSIARRTTFGFSTGTSLITYPETALADSEGGGARSRFRVSGTVDLRHEMGRTWTASVGYQRGVQFLEGWPEPLFSDAASAKLDGSPTRRVQFSASFRASTGRGARRVDGNGFNYYHGGANLTYAFSRHLNAGVLYSTYRHRFGEGLALPPGFGPWFDRHRVMVQVSAWAPLFSRARRGNATR